MNIDKLIQEFESNPDNGKAMSNSGFLDVNYEYAHKFVRWLSYKIPEPKQSKSVLKSGS